MISHSKRTIVSIVMGTFLLLSSFIPAQIQAQAATPVTPTDLGCTIWRTGANSPTTPEECSSSAPWWDSWSDCAMTPVHNEPWIGEAGLNGLPWIPIAMGPEPLQATAHLFFGNRPLPIGDTFPNGGERTKVLWTFDHDVRNFSVTATNRNDASFKDVIAADTGPADTNTDSSRSWPSYVFVPAAGCWDFTLKAEDVATGKAVSGHFTFIAVK